MRTLYAEFPTTDKAVRALGALGDHGVHKKHLSLVADQRHLDDLYTKEAAEEARKRMKGVTRTTGDDAATGALKGAGLGLGIGFLGGLASLFIPGFGLVFGSGALATASAAALGAGAGGLIGGGVAGYLEDQGIHRDTAHKFQKSFEEGGAIVGVDIDAAKLDSETIGDLMAKYGGRNITVARPTVSR